MFSSRLLSAFAASLEQQISVGPSGKRKPSCFTCRTGNNGPGHQRAEPDFPVALCSAPEEWIRYCDCVPLRTERADFVRDSTAVNPMSEMNEARPSEATACGDKRERPGSAKWKALRVAPAPGANASPAPGPAERANRIVPGRACRAATVTCPRNGPAPRHSRMRTIRSGH